MSIYLFIDEPGIGLVDRTDHLDTSSRGNLSFNLQLNQRGSASVPLIIKDPWADYRPVVGAPVYLYDVPAGGSAPTGPQVQTEPVLVGTAAAAILGSGFAIWVQVTARADNAGDVRLGGTALVGPTDGIPLSPGAPYFFPVISGKTYDLSTMYWYGAVGDKLDVEWLDVGGSGYCVFAGTVSDIDTRWLSNTKTRTAQLTVSSLEQVFDSLIVDPVAFFNESCGDIIRYLLYNVAIGVPVVAGDIQDGPRVPSLVVDFQRMSDIFTNLAGIAGATGTNYVWGVDPATSSLYFGPESTTPAPLDFVTEMAKWNTFRHKETRADYRNREIIRVAQDAFNVTVFEAIGDGSTKNYTLANIVKQITKATIGGSGAASAADTGTFTGQPTNPVPLLNDPHGAITIGATTYPFVTFLGEAKFNVGHGGLYPASNQVLIGATAAETYSNLLDAINGNTANLNITYGYSTGADPIVGGAVVGTTLTVTAQSSGSAGNAVTVSTTNTNFSWTNPTLTGGSDPSTSDSLNVGIEGDGALHDLYYTVGSADIRLTNAPAAGKTLAVSFYPVGGDVIQVDNRGQIAARAAIEHGTGKYDHIISDGSITDRDVALVIASTTLDNWDAIPETWSVETDQPGFLPGQSVTVLVLSPEGIGDYVNGLWICHEVSASMVPQLETAAFNDTGQDAPSEHFRYTITFMSSPIASYINYWQQLGQSASV